jgi:3-methyl-2-oxobutanoate hydroxymethyltransferase
LANPPEARPYAPPVPPGRPTRLAATAFAKMAAEGRRIAMLTAYDATIAAMAERAGVDVLLVGDSLGMVIQGHPTTLPVTLEQLLYHVRCVVNGCARPLVIADLPFGTFQESREAAYRASVEALKAGAQMVKIEGGEWVAPTVEFLTSRGVPVCGHVGLLPQSVNVYGGYRIQGKTPDAAERLVADARALAQAGASLAVIECVPAAIGARITREAGLPTIGIGAGPDCSGQVLVVYDALGMHTAKPARFVRNFMAGHDSVEGALAAYVAAVRDGSFPAAEHCF